MMSEWIRAGLDLVLIVMVGVGLVQATRLIRHLAGLRASRAEMERFVREFNATVMRAEAGIKGLRRPRATAATIWKSSSTKRLWCATN